MLWEERSSGIRRSGRTSSFKANLPFYKSWQCTDLGKVGYNQQIRAVLSSFSPLTLLSSADSFIPLSAAQCNWLQVWNGAEIVRGSTAVSTTRAELVWLSLLLVLILVSRTPTQQLWKIAQHVTFGALTHWTWGDSFPVWALCGLSSLTRMSPVKLLCLGMKLNFCKHLQSKQMHLKEKYGPADWMSHLLSLFKKWDKLIRTRSLSTNPDKWSGSNNYFWLSNILFDDDSIALLLLCHHRSASEWTNIHPEPATLQFQLIYSCISITVIH